MPMRTRNGRATAEEPATPAGGGVALAASRSPQSEWNAGSPATSYFEVAERLIVGHPITALTFALGIGVTLGWLIKRR